MAGSVFLEFSRMVHFDELRSRLGPGAYPSISLQMRGFGNLEFGGDLGAVFY
jgi:hypothetical protein